MKFYTCKWRFLYIDPLENDQIKTFVDRLLATALWWAPRTRFASISLIFLFGHSTRFWASENRVRPSPTLTFPSAFQVRHSWPRAGLLEPAPQQTNNHGESSKWSPIIRSESFPWLQPSNLILPPIAISQDQGLTANVLEYAGYPRAYPFD